MDATKRNNGLLQVNTREKGKVREVEKEGASP